MQSLESYVVLGGYLAVSILLLASYVVLCGLRLRALIQERASDGVTLWEFKQWQLRLVTSRYKRALEWMLFSISVVLQIAGFLYWNQVFAGTPSMPLAHSPITVLTALLAVAILHWWMKRKLGTKSEPELPL